MNRPWVKTSIDDIKINMENRHVSVIVNHSTFPRKNNMQIECRIECIRQNEMSTNELRDINHMKIWKRVVCYFGLTSMSRKREIECYKKKEGKA